jgi:pilus assembly protein Flp/PilA
MPHHGSQGQGEERLVAAESADRRPMSADRPTCRPAGWISLAAWPMPRRISDPPGFPGTGGAVPSHGRDHRSPTRPKEPAMMNVIVSLQEYLSSALHRDDRGATAVEYGLLVALIAAVIVGIVATLGTQISTAFATISAAL